MWIRSQNKDLIVKSKLVFIEANGGKAEVI